MIVFSQRELTRAWKRAREAANKLPRSNAHRLLLFYAAECGLKATYLKRQNQDLLDSFIGEALKHNLNRVLDRLNVGAQLKLPDDLQLQSLRGKDGAMMARHCSCGDLNQVWRYGGELVQPQDSEIEIQLEKINEWIAKEIH